MEADIIHNGKLIVGYGYSSSPVLEQDCFSFLVTVADSGDHFCISGADVIDGEREELPQ